MKKLCLTINDFFDLTGAVLYNSEKIKPVTKVTIDSRAVSEGSLFIAIKGEKFDGHDFVNEAVKKGAKVVLINKQKLKLFDGISVPIIAVNDTTLALGELAAVWRKKLSTKIIALTGSAGKTTTKELLYTLLSGKFNVNKTLANNNNHIGVPLTIFSTTNKHDYLVLELGTNHFGEIKYTADIAQPNFALITNIGNSHLEFLNNKAGVFKEKSALFSAAVSKGGTIFINEDDEFLKSTKKKYSKRVTYGFNVNADVKGEVIGYSEDGNPQVQIGYKGKKSVFNVPLYGEQSAKNFLIASTVALKVGMSFDDIKRRIKKFSSVDKRLNVRKLGNFILINDTYNANPDSMKMSLQLLSRITKYEKRVAILGDMFELGRQSKHLHESLAKEIIQNKINSVYLVGKMMRYLYKKLKSSDIEAAYFEDRESLKNFLKFKSFARSVVLVKGSRGMKMEEFIDKINTN